MIKSYHSRTLPLVAANIARFVMRVFASFTRNHRRSFERAMRPPDSADIQRRFMPLRRVALTFNVLPSLVFGAIDWTVVNVQLAWITLCRAAYPIGRIRPSGAACVRLRYSADGVPRVSGFIKPRAK